jgi:XTP/dITP diphosphohydrolase
MHILLATNNQHKVDELSEILASFDLPITVISQKTWFEGNSPEIDETGSTLEENALLKAQTLHALTSMPVIADDTGLEVLTLGNAPGVHSARYAGEHGNDAANRQKLLHALSDSSDRSARFRTILHFIDGQSSFHVEGICEGHIAHHEIGEHGFGYDSIFIPKGETETFAEMSGERKHSMSHRARACIELGKRLSEHIQKTS